MEFFHLTTTTMKNLDDFDHDENVDEEIQALVNDFSPVMNVVFHEFSMNDDDDEMTKTTLKMKKTKKMMMTMKMKMKMNLMMNDVDVIVVELVIDFAISIDYLNDFVDVDSMIDEVRILELHVLVLLFLDVHVVDLYLSEIVFSINFAFDDEVFLVEFLPMNFLFYSNRRCCFDLFDGRRAFERRFDLVVALLFVLNILEDLRHRHRLRRHRRFFRFFDDDFPFD